MHRFVYLLLIVTFCMALLPFTPSKAIELTSEEERRVDSLIAGMTLEEKVGQMFMVNIPGRALGDRAAEFIATYHPGAVALFGANLDEEPASQVATFINQIQEVSSTTGANIPMFIAVDQEGGRVRRLVNDVTYFPDPIMLGAMTEPESVERYGAAMGVELHEIGFNMNLAPVADLMSRADALNPYSVVNRRTFGDDPDRVGWQTAAFAAGLAQHQVVGVLKHYPGHGGAGDSHANLPIITTDAETARATALRAFEVAVEHGAPAIMVGHLYFAEIEIEENLPSTLSPTMLGILRDDFGFDGVIMTDAMDMGALANNFYVPDAALMFVQAGGDMFVAGPYLTWEMQQLSMQRLIDAVHSGELDEARIDESVRRILSLKAAYGLLDWTPTQADTVAERIDLEAAQQALFETYLDAATVVRDTNNLLPLSPDDNLAIVFPGLYHQINDVCREYAPDAVYHGYIFQPADWEYGFVSSLGQQHDKIVIFIEDAILNPAHADLVKLLPPEKTIVVAMGLPFDLDLLGDISTFMVMYHSLVSAREASCHILFGDHPATGRLPVAVGEYPTGTGIDVSLPEN